MKKVVRRLLIASILFICSGNIIAQTGCSWQQGEITTYTQAQYGDQTSSAGDVVVTHFGQVFPSGIIIGGANTLQFTSAASVINFLPATGAPASLTGSYTDPLTTPAGELAGEILALKLNVAFSDADIIGAQSLSFGDLVFHDFTDVPELNGVSIRNFFNTANVFLGGGSSAFTAGTLSAVANVLNTAFLNGTPSQFALDHLKRGWSSGDKITYTQSLYGDASSNAASLLVSHWFDLYGAGALVVGQGNTITFSGAPAIDAYLPATGTPGSLTSSLQDPLTTVSGDLGGQVLALQLNVDLSDANYLTGNSSVKFGDIFIGNFPQVAVANGMKVREFLNLANFILGGGSAVIGPSSTDAFLSLLNNAFLNGTPSQFAQQYLFYPCTTNHCPTTNPLNVTTAPGTKVLIPLQASDADNDLLNFAITQNPTQGTLFTDADGAIFYTPNAGFAGKDTLLFSASDGKCEVKDSVFISVECVSLGNAGIITFPIAEWGVSGDAENLLNDNFSSLFNSGLIVGITGTTGCYEIAFTLPDKVQLFLANQTGAAGSLDQNWLNPDQTSAGVLASQITTLYLNMRYSDAGLLGEQGAFGDLYFCNTSINELNGLTVRQFLDTAINRLSCGTTIGGSFSAGTTSSIVNSLTQAFIGGVPSTWASTFLSSCPCGTTPPNHCPVTISSSVTTSLSTSINVQLQASDEDNDVLSYSISQNPLHGTVTTSSTGAASYTPTAGYYGADEFKFKASDGKCDAEGTVDILIVVCPKLKGDWKNNPNAWPASATPMLLGTQSYTKNQLLVILTTPVGTGPKADASLILAQQLIPAKLNIANGTQAPASVTGYISSANALIGGNIIPMKVKPSSALGKSMTANASLLESFNNGALSTGCPLNSVIAAASAQRGITSEEVMEVAKELEVKATPNPTNNNFNVYVRSNNLMDKITLQVIDMYGRVIEVRNVNANSMIRFGDRYSPGTYFVRIIQRREHKEIKLIKLSH